MNLDINGLKPLVALSLFYSICAVNAGAVFLFIYERELFMSLDAFRLTILSLGITVPAFFAGSTILSDREGISNQTQNPEGEMLWARDIVVTGSIGAIIILTTLSIGGYFFYWQTKWAIGIFLVGTFIVAFIKEYRKRKRKKKEKKADMA